MTAYPSIGAMLDAQHGRPPQPAPARRPARASARANAPANRRNPMTARITDAGQAADHAMKAIAAAAQALAHLDANELIRRLDAEGLGHGLKPDEVGAVLLLVRSLEEGRGTQQLPQRTPGQP